MKLFPEGVGILFALCFFLAFLECSPTLPKTFLFSCDHSCYVISSLYSYHSPWSIFIFNLMKSCLYFRTVLRFSTSASPLLLSFLLRTQLYLVGHNSELLMLGKALIYLCGKGSITFFLHSLQEFKTMLDLQQMLIYLA